MNKKLIIVSAVFALVLSGFSLAEAKPGKGKGYHAKTGCQYCAKSYGKRGGGHGHGQGHSPVAQKLIKKAKFFLEHQDKIGLSDKQATKIKDLKIATKKNAIQMMADIKIFMVDVHSELGEKTVNVEAINKLIDSQTSALAAQMKVNVQSFADLKSTLTRSQMKKAKALWKKKAKKMMRHK